MTDLADALPTTDTSGLAVSLTGIRRVFPGGVVALDGVDLYVPPGQFLAILGPSGCGKSTLLRQIARLDTPDAGMVSVESTGTSDVAYVFQDAHLLPWRNVLRNVALPLELMGVARGERLAAAEAALVGVGLGDALRRFPAQLSGGMKMRVSLARALVTKPRLLLLDEPFAALDEITRHRLDEQLRDLWADRRMTVVFVTHSISEAAFLAERAVVMSKRPGRAVLDHAIELPNERRAELRGEPSFAAQTGILLNALIRGGA